jgi:uncharacterized protein (DUF849 family)
VREAQPVIINLALTGMVASRGSSPHVPLSVGEILDDVARCRELGVSIVHVHARDERGVPTHRSDYFAPIVEGIRRIGPDLIVCVTCSGRFVDRLDQRAEVLELSGDAKPDMASLTLGSNNFRRQASVNPPEVIEGLAERMSQQGIKPELEVFEPGMVAFGKHLVARGLIEEPCYVNILLGNPGTSPLGAASLAAFLALVPDDWTWALAGIGRHQLRANALALAAGGHVRVGLEDNLWFDGGRRELATNASLVERIARLADLLERPLARPASAREMLGLGARTTPDSAALP